MPSLVMAFDLGAVGIASSSNISSMECVEQQELVITVVLIIVVAVIIGNYWPAARSQALFSVLNGSSYGIP